MAVTLQQIADKAGVSRGTVDRALNNRGRINPEVAFKIRRIAEEMGYQPNRAGRALAMARRAVRIGVIVQGADTPFMKIVLEGVQEAREEVERLGASVIIKTIGRMNPEMVISAMEELKAEGCSGIALVPSDDRRVMQKINLLAEENIPVVTFNTDLEDSRRLCFVGQDTLQSGRAAAGLMAELLPAGGIVQVISGYPSHRGHKNRTRGFLEELAVCRPDLQVLEVKYAYDDDDAASEIVERLLKEGRDICGIYLAASGVEGVCRVLKEQGRVGEIKVISNDLTPMNIRELKKGTIQFLLGQNAHAQGYQPIMLLFNKLFDGAEPECEMLYTEIVIKTRYNC